MLLKALLIALTISIVLALADDALPNPFQKVAEQQRTYERMCDKMEKSEDYRQGYHDALTMYDGRDEQAAKRDKALDEREANLNAYKDKLDIEKDDFYRQKHDPYLDLSNRNAPGPYQSPVAQAAQQRHEPKAKPWWKKAAKATGDNGATQIWGSNASPTDSTDSRHSTASRAAAASNAAVDNTAAANHSDSTNSRDINKTLLKFECTDLKSFDLVVTEYR